MLIPSFVKLDISDLPALLGSFALGPVYGVVVELIKNLLHILIKGTSSAYVGELFNFTMGAVMCPVSYTHLSITDLLVTPGYFAANGDGSYKAVMPYTAQKADSAADQTHPDGTSNAASTGGET